MLILSRKVGERVILIYDGKIVGAISVQKNFGGKISIAHEGVREMKFLREEICEKFTGIKVPESWSE